MLHNALVRFCNDTINDESVYFRNGYLQGEGEKGETIMSSYVKKNYLFIRLKTLLDPLYVDVYLC